MTEEQNRLVSLHALLAVEALRALSAKIDPASLNIYSLDAPTGSFKIIQSLPDSLKKLVLNGENSQAAFSHMAGVLLNKSTSEHKHFVKKQGHKPAAMALVTEGQRRVAAPTAAAQYEPVLLVLLQSENHRLLGVHPFTGTHWLYNPQVRWLALTDKPAHAPR